MEAIRSVTRLRHILDMIALCADAGLRPPEFLQEGGQFIRRLWRPVSAETGTSSTGSPTQTPTQSTDPVMRLLLCLREAELSPADLREPAGRGPCHTKYSRVRM